MILCTVPPPILCRPNTIRYSLVLNVHDQRHRPGTSSSKTVKVSSPTLRKLCLPCITTRHRHEQENLSTKRPTSKPNQHRLNPSETIVDQSSLVRSDVVSRTFDPISTVNVLNSSESTKKNDANHSDERHVTDTPSIIDDHVKDLDRSLTKTDDDERIELNNEETVGSFSYLE